MHFTQEQVASYHENGYVAGPKVLADDQIETLRQRFDDIINHRIENYPEELRAQVPPETGAFAGVKIVNLLRHDSVFRDVLLNNQAISNLAHDLMPGPVRVWQDQAITKPPHDAGACLGWHQDYAYNDQIKPMDWLTCWIAIDDAFEANGCMKMIPKSHRWSLRYHRDDVDTNGTEWLLHHEDIPKGSDLTQAIIEVKAGHCHFHHCKTFHASYGNTTEFSRRSYIPIFIPDNTVKASEDWNPGRHASIGSFEIGQQIQGPDFPELLKSEPKSALVG